MLKKYIVLFSVLSSLLFVPTVHAQIFDFISPTATDSFCVGEKIKVKFNSSIEGQAGLNLDMWNGATHSIGLYEVKEGVNEIEWSVGDIVGTRSGSYELSGSGRILIEDAGGNNGEYSDGYFSFRKCSSDKGACGSAAEVSTNMIPSKNLCSDGDNPTVYSGGVSGPKWPAGTISGDWYWWCGDTMCHAPDPYKEYKSPFASTMMESYTGDPKSPDTATVWLQWFCSSGTPKQNQPIYNDYETVSCEYGSSSNYGGCDWCVMSKFKIKKKGAVEGVCEWKCGDWGECSDGVRTRTCNNPSGCKSNSPTLSERCDSQEVSCGSSAGKSFDKEPESGLCNNGEAIIVVGNNPWFWICQDKEKGKAILCSTIKAEERMNGVCGSMNGQTLSSTPGAGLCATGTPSQVYGSGPWIWICNGSNGGKSSACFSKKDIEIAACNDIYAPVCGTDGKTYSNDCYAKMAKATVQYDGECSKVNKCGKANGVSAVKTPTKDLCTIDDGTLVHVESNEGGNWIWKCGEESCRADDPNGEYKKEFGATEMSEYTGNPERPDTVTIALNHHCNWLPSGDIFKNYEKLSCRYEDVGSHGVCPNCSSVLIKLEKIGQ
jgi:hypothetical protein